MLPIFMLLDELLLLGIEFFFIAAIFFTSRLLRNSIFDFFIMLLFTFDTLYPGPLSPQNLLLLEGGSLVHVFTCLLCFFASAFL
uniref:Transmembrane protein n=1 Tax=Medicago truncatula TaxID=3880 RepID=I3S0R0_MEDTR|nr:unknown [Medicago truncatula]